MDLTLAIALRFLWVKQDYIGYLVIFEQSVACVKLIDGRNLLRPKSLAFGADLVKRHKCFLLAEFSSLWGRFYNIHFLCAISVLLCVEDIYEEFNERTVES